MFTHKDIEYRNIFVINCIDDQRTLRVHNGQLQLEVNKDGGSIVLTRLPFQKILAIFVIGHACITTPLIDKCKQYNVALVVMNARLRPVFYWTNNAEANYLLRQRQFTLSSDDLSIAQRIVWNKVYNQHRLLQKTRRKDMLTQIAINLCDTALNTIYHTNDLSALMGLEGIVARSFFDAYFQDCNWDCRRPRTKCDMLNAILDIGYTLLFNFIEVFVRMFGFDPYIGVYHRLWFKRKSLICDLVEPFRCIIDHTTRKALALKQFTEKDFIIRNNEYHLRIERNSHYCKIFYQPLVEQKTAIFRYMQAYYRSFMQQKSPQDYPLYEI